MKTNLFSYLIKTTSRLQASKSNTGKLRSSVIKFVLTFYVLSISSSLYGQKQAVAHESPDSTPVKQLIGQTQETQGSLSLKDFKVTFNPPAGNKPQSSAGGASRSIGQCIMQAENSNLPLTPLLPADALGLTVSSHPTVLAYLPEINANKVFFSWQDENNQEHYQTILPIANQEGIISLTLPEDAPPLEVGKNYQWALAIMCDGRLQPDSPMIQGQIQRVEVEPSVSDRLVSANALEIAAIYGEAGIWYETVATLAQLKITQPNHASLKDNWQELLASVGLEKVAATSLILKGE